MAIGAGEARRRLELGVALLHERQRLVRGRVDGCVPPAWLLGAAAWQALRAASFVYTSTWRHFHLLAAGAALFAPALVYSARHRG